MTRRIWLVETGRVFGIGIWFAVTVFSCFLLLVSCAEKGGRTLPVAPPPVASSQNRPLRSVVVQAKLPELRANWSGDDSTCPQTLQLKSPSLTLIIAQPDFFLITLTMLLDRRIISQPFTGGPMTLKFTGSGTEWQIIGQSEGRSNTFSLPADDGSLGRMMALLNGGTVELDWRNRTMQVVAVPVAGELGQKWFECARSKIL